MRFALLAAAVLVASPALAKPPPPPPGAPAFAGTKADAGLVARSALQKELPKLAPADRAALDAVVRDLKADRLEAAAARYRTWTSGTPKPLTRDEANATALWVFREGFLLAHDDVAQSADRIRFLDERNAALDDSIAVLRAAAVAKKPVLVARIVVVTPYVREQRGNETRERQIGRDTYEAEIAKLTVPSDETRAERDRARAAFSADARALQCLADLQKSAIYAKIVPRV